MAQEHHSTLDQAAQHIELVEFRPTVLNNLAGKLGRLVVPRGGSEGYASRGEEYSLQSLLDHYEQEKGVPELEMWPERSGDIEEDAGPLLSSLWASPRLEKPLFIPNLREVKSTPVCKIKASYSEWASLPVSNFVSAPGISSWNEGNGSKKSRQIIRSYARQSEHLEPIDLVSAYVQPNGVVLYQLLRNGAHRLTAAHLKGEKGISVNSTITVNRLSKNIVPLLQTRMPEKK